MRTLAQHIDLDAIRSHVSVPAVLRESDAKICRQRADCPICSHLHHKRSSGKFTLAFNQTRWFCHRCNTGGDVFSLWSAVHNCDFVTSLHALATMAGISATATDRAALARERRQRELKKDEEELKRLRERQSRIAARTWLLSLIADYRKTNERLSELRSGLAAETFSGELELCWLDLSITAKLIERADKEYCAIAEVTL